MASSVKEMRDENQRGTTEQPKLPQPSEAPEMLERLKQPLNGKVLARSSPPTLFCQEKVLTRAMSVLSLDRENLHVLGSPGVTENRLMKDDSKLGFWRGEQNEEKQLKKGKLILWWAVGSKRTFGSARCISRSENLTMAARGWKFGKTGCPPAARWKGAPDFRKIAACLSSPTRLNPSTPDCRDCLGLVTSPVKCVGASKQSGRSTAWLWEPKIGTITCELKPPFSFPTQPCLSGTCST
ncbi:hypothetical protein Nmel_013392 [Mimus melanotis]